MFIRQPVKRARAALLAIISAEEPEMPDPAGDSENVSSRKPPFGMKKRTRQAAKGCRYDFAASSAASVVKRSSREVSCDFRTITCPARGVIRHEVRMFRAMFTLTAPG